MLSFVIFHLAVTPNFFNEFIPGTKSYMSFNNFIKCFFARRNIYGNKDLV